MAESMEITIYPKGQEPIRLGKQKAILTFDLRLTGYTAAEMLDLSKPLGTPRHATLKVFYDDGSQESWSFSRDGYEAKSDDHGGMSFFADAVQKVLPAGGG